MRGKKNKFNIFHRKNKLIRVIYINPQKHKCFTNFADNS